MIINILILFFVLLLLLLLSMIWPPNSPWAPNWRTNKKTALAICKLAKVSKKDTIYDLGSGDGEALLTAAKQGAKGVGIEIEPSRFFISKLRAKRNGVEDLLEFRRNDFFKENLKDATIVFVYLVPKTLSLLIPKFKKELKKGTKIVSYKYTMDLKLIGEDLNNEIYLYTI